MLCVRDQPDVPPSHRDEIFILIPLLQYIKLSMGSCWMGNHIKSSKASSWMGDHIKSSKASSWMGDHIIVELTNKGMSLVDGSRV